MSTATAIEQQEEKVILTEDVMNEYDQKFDVPQELEINEVKKILSRENYAEKDRLSKIDNPDNFYPRLKEFRNTHNDPTKVNFIVEDINNFIETRFKKVMLIACRHYDNKRHIEEEKKKMLVEEQKLLDNIIGSISEFKIALY